MGPHRAPFYINTFSGHKEQLKRKKKRGGGGEGGKESRSKGKKGLQPKPERGVPAPVRKRDPARGDPPVEQNLDPGWVRNVTRACACVSACVRG